MRVRLLNPHASDGRDFRHSLTVDREYEVIGICCNDYQLLDDDCEPILYDAICFEVTDPSEPPFWITKYGEEGERYSHPPGWNVPGFFEAWHDEVKIVRKVFAEQLAYWFPEIVVKPRAICSVPATHAS